MMEKNAFCSRRYITCYPSVIRTSGIIFLKCLQLTQLRNNRAIRYRHSADKINADDINPRRSQTLTVIYWNFISFLIRTPRSLHSKHSHPVGTIYSLAFQFAVNFVESQSFFGRFPNGLRNHVDIADRRLLRSTCARFFRRIGCTC